MHSEFLSVIVATHNRSADVTECVREVVRQSKGLPVQIVLVDSASSIEHACALRAFAEECAQIEFIRLEEKGVSRARNAGMSKARADWIGLVDDDSYPFPDWISRALAITQSAPSRVAAVGGRIVPRWPSHPHDHVGERWMMFLSCIESEHQPRFVDPRCHGANMLVRRANALAVGGFSERVGRVGTTLLSGEEPLLLKKIARVGGEIVFDPTLSVEHKISADRLTKGWIRSRAFWGGITEVLVVRELGGGFPWHLNPIKVALSIPFLALLAKAFDRQYDHYIRLCYAFGVMRAHFIRHDRNPARKP